MTGFQVDLKNHSWYCKKITIYKHSFMYCKEGLAVMALGRDSMFH